MKKTCNYCSYYSQAAWCSTAQCRAVQCSL